MSFAVYLRYCVGALVVNLLILCAASACAQDTGEGFRRGDKVLYGTDRLARKAVVVEVMAGGRVRIKFEDAKIAPPVAVPARLLRRAPAEEETDGHQDPAPAGSEDSGADQPEDDNPFATAAEKPRVWTDTTGKFKIEATFVDLKDGQVVLQRTDGPTIQVPLEKLSEDDQRIAAEFADGGAVNPFDPKNSGVPAADAAPLAVEVLWGGTWFKAEILKRKEDQFYVRYDGWGDGHNEWVTADKIRCRDGQPVDLAVLPESGPEPTKYGFEISSAKTSNVRVVSAQQNPGAWSLSPDALVVDETPFADQPIRFPVEFQFFETPKTLVISPQLARALVCFVNEDPSLPEFQTRVMVCDLEKGDAEAGFVLPGGGLPLDVTSDGQQLLARSTKFGIGGSDRLDIWRPGADGVQHVVSWHPNEMAHWSERDISWARFVDADHVLTLSNNKLVLWNISDIAAVYELQVAFNAVPALSSNRRQMAVSTGDGIGIFEPLTGQMLARIDQRPGFGATLAFRPDGERLAAAFGQRLQLWDLTSGKLERDMALSGVTGRQIDWVDDQHVLADDRYLVDLERRIVLWDYPGAALVETHAGVAWCCLSRTNGYALIPARLPHPEALQVAASLDPDELLLVKPGIQVSLDLRIQASPQQRQSIQQSLTNQLQENGFQVVANAPIQLVASTRTGQQREVTYRPFGARLGGGDQEYQRTLTEHISHVAFLHQGKVAWESQSVSLPGTFLQLEENQTIDQAIAEAQRADLSFFETVELPTHIVRPTGKTAYGTTNLSF